MPGDGLSDGDPAQVPWGNMVANPLLLDWLARNPRLDGLAALDIGCGTGANAIRLARLGLRVTLLDASSAMLDLAQRAAQAAGVADRTTVRCGDAAQVSSAFPAGSFDLVLCHNLLEYVDDPAAVLCGATQLLRDSSATVSILVRNQAGEAFKAALQAADLEEAERMLAAEWGQESLYGGKVRLFSPASLEAMLKRASLTSVATRGVRVLADYLPSHLSPSTQYERIFALERKLGSRPDCAAVARYTHCLARRAELGA